MKYILSISLLVVLQFFAVKLNAQVFVPVFDEPQKIISIASEADELAPIPYKAGEVLYFVRSNSNGTAKERKLGQEIWQVERKDNAWGSPENIFKEANDIGNNAVIGSSLNGDTIYLFNSIQSRRKLARGIAYTYKTPKGWASLKKIKIKGFELGEGLYSFYLNDTEDVLLISMAPNDATFNEDLFVSEKIGDSWTEVKSLGPTINTDSFEISPFLSKDKKALYFSSNGHGGYGDADIFVSYRSGDGWDSWTKPLNLGNTINSSGFDAYFIIGNNKEVFFASNREMRSTDIYTTKLASERSVQLAGAFSQGQLYANGITPKNVELIVYDVNGNYSETVKTDENGKFQFKKLASDNIGLIHISEEDLLDLSNGIIYILDKDGNKIKRVTSSLDGSFYFGSEKIILDEIAGTFTYNKLPADNKKILVYNDAGDIIDSIYTDEFGRFSYKRLKSDENYTFKINDVEDVSLLDLNIDFDSRIDEIMKGLFTYNKLPLSNQAIVVYNEEGLAIDTLTTDEFGYFNYQKLKASGNYSFKPLNLNENESENFEMFLDTEGDEFSKGAFSYNKLPFSNQKVLVYNEDGEVIDSLFTNEKGQFVYRKLNLDKNYFFKPANLDDIQLADFEILIEEGGKTRYKEIILGMIEINGVPYSNKALVIIDENGFPIDTFYTDKWGKFEYYKLKGDKDYSIRPLDSEDASLENINIYLIDKDGKKIKEALSEVPTIESTSEVEVKEAIAEVEDIKKPQSKTVKQSEIRIYFDFNDYSISEENKTTLDKLISKLNPKDKVYLEGYTDNIGTSENNLKVAKWRAENTKKYLEQKGVKSSNIKTEAKGKKDPIATNKTNEGRAKNRRVEINIK